MISVAVCTFNRYESLRDTLESLRNQQLKPGLSLEILVVDNNSTDLTRQVVEEIAATSRWPVRYVFEPRQGLSYARNRAVQETKGKLLAFTDDDVIAESHWIQALVDAFGRYHADCVGGRILPLWQETPPVWINHQALRVHLWNALAMLDEGPNVIISSPSNCHFPFGANMAFRRSVFKDVGSFRTDLGFGRGVMFKGEDTEFVSRFGDAGKRVVYAPEAIVHHKVPKHRMQLNYFRHWKFSSGRSVARIIPNSARRIPLWLVRECAQSGVKACFHYAQRRRIQGIEEELTFWSSLGRCVGLLEDRWQHERNGTERNK